MTAFVAADLYKFDLGVEDGGHLTISLPIFSSKSKEYQPEGTLNQTQLWLSRGLVWYYAFNHEESIQCFKKALELGGNPVMAHYFISLCHGPNYNTETMNRDQFPSAKDAYQECQTALALLKEDSSYLSDVEIALVEALPCRFNNPDDEEFQGLDAIDQNTDIYAEAMLAIYQRFPQDPNVACMYAEALLNKSPWHLWDLNTGLATPHAILAEEVLQKALLIAPNHPGLNHFMVHLMEMSPHPEASLASCAVLRKYFPSAGHLIHMPSHIYVLLGMWQEAADCNIEAWKVDDVYVEKEGIYNYYTGYRLHNLHFISYAGMFAGRYAESMHAAQEVKRNLPDSLLTNPIMNRFFESFLSIEVHVLIRFGKWADILSREVPTDHQLHGYTIATLHYARGIAHAVLGDTSSAAQELALLRQSAPLVGADHVLHNNLCSDMLAIAEHMLQGELYYRLGQYEEAFWELNMAATLSDDLVYDEPWGWMQPPLHALGALSLEQGQVENAEKYFRRDMDKSLFGRCHPDNLWALKGLEQCLVRRPVLLPSTDASVRAAELVEVREKIAALEKRSDVGVKVACMCAVKK